MDRLFKDLKKKGNNGKNKLNKEIEYLKVNVVINKEFVNRCSKD